MHDLVLALKAIRAARCVFLLPLLVVLLSPLAFLATAKWGPLRSATPLATTAGTAAPESEPTTQQAWTEAASRVMAVAPPIARATTILLAVLYFLAIVACLTGDSGGAEEAIFAFVWAIVLFVVLIPWHAWVGGHQFLEVFYDINDLLAAERQSEGAWPSLSTDWSYYVRFLLFPFLALLAAVVADIRFGRSYRIVMQRIRTQVEASAR